MTVAKTSLDMPSIEKTIRRLLPDDPGWDGISKWPALPKWPPDLFAVSATLVNNSQCFRHRRYIALWRNSCFFNSARYREAQQIGIRWCQDGRLSENDRTEMERLWRVVRLARNQEVVEHSHPISTGNHRPWWDAALTLMAVADEAASGIGFVAIATQPRPLADYYLWFMEEVARTGDRELSSSLCIAVPREEVCVQPKTRTPEVGCTLRSLSHNLALLPHHGIFATSWLTLSTGVPQNVGGIQDETFNIMIVPFPFRVKASCFSERSRSNRSKGHFFSLEQQWLWHRGRKIGANRVASFLKRLIREAERELGPRQIHAIILPEGALDEDLAQKVSRLLRGEGLAVFVSGVLEKDVGGVQKNCAWVVAYTQNSIPFIAQQYKHHRWRLEGSQIRRYNLGSALNPKTEYWEEINVRDREAAFFVFRHGAVLTSLVCEDLARIDPIGEIIRSIGPNLVVVLLMDGPQLEFRWPGRYATVLADDPGSAVLTLTSMGMVRRSAKPGERERREIALWKEPGGETHELKLPKDCHALVLTLSQSDTEQTTLDGRTDPGRTVKISLTGVTSVADPERPDWLLSSI